MASLDSRKMRLSRYIHTVGVWITLVLVPTLAQGQTFRTIVAGGAHGTVTIAAAVAVAKSGDTVVVMPGVYKEPTIVIDKPLTLKGYTKDQGAIIIDGESKRQILVIRADDVTVRHLEFRNVGASHIDDLAAIKVIDVKNCTIEDTRINNGFFGIYLANAVGCKIRRNTIRGTARSETTSGNGIQLWSSRDATIEGNSISGHRDGIYFEFVKNTEVSNNTSEHNVRYGLHFMYSDDCRYMHNVFRQNTAGVAVMYTRRVLMADNRFEQNWGSASYGLLFKEISDSHIERNVFSGNTVGLTVDGANRIVAVRNEFRNNGWALKVLANTEEGQFRANNFIDNTFDISISRGQTSTRLSGNYWSDYRGYDLDRNGTGDIPFRPVRLFSMIVGQTPPALILLRSMFIHILDLAERVLPVLTPAGVVDDRPAMRPIDPSIA